MSASCGISNSVNGTPMWLLRFPRVANVLENVVCKTASSSSLVVVFPLLPVSPMTGNFQRDRCRCASDCRAISTSGTSRHKSDCLAMIGSSTIARIHPAFNACNANSFPSNRSPFRAKNSLPCSAMRVSVVTPLDFWKAESIWVKIELVASMSMRLIYVLGCHGAYLRKEKGPLSRSLF